MDRACCSRFRFHCCSATAAAIAAAIATAALCICVEARNKLSRSALTVKRWQQPQSLQSIPLTHSLLSVSLSPSCSAVCQQMFDIDEVKGIIDASIDPVLGQQVYAPKRVSDWTSAIVESVLKSLQTANKPFKYVVTCIIMQKNGAGLHTASTCFWDTKSDGEYHRETAVIQLQ